MATVFANSINNAENSCAIIVEQNNKILELSQKIASLEKEVKEKQDTIEAIEANMECFYVENWKTTDSNGKKGEFSGNICWIKGSGMIYYKNGTYYEGDWDSTGEFGYGELRGTHSDVLITKWEGGVEVEEEEEEVDSQRDAEEQEEETED
jgi:hypothetical protein